MARINTTPPGSQDHTNAEMFVTKGSLSVSYKHTDFRKRIVTNHSRCLKSENVSCIPNCSKKTMLM